jgi:hypothetical protein
MRKFKQHCALIFAGFLLGSCQTTIPPEALQLSEVTLEDRQLQSRRFETNDEKKIISSVAAVLQDLGFNLDESETKLGVIVASKDRDAVEAGQVVGAVVLAVLFGANAATFDKKQKMRASVITSPTKENGTLVRTTFQRIVWNQRGIISKLERLNDPKAYQNFFSKLSKAVFLEAHKI